MILRHVLLVWACALVGLLNWITVQMLAVSGTCNASQRSVDKPVLRIMTVVVLFELLPEFSCKHVHRGGPAHRLPRLFGPVR